MGEVAQGLLPIGGLAHHLATCCDEGRIVGRSGGGGDWTNVPVF